MTKFICDTCLSSNFQVLYLARGSFTKVYLITDTSYGQHPQIVKCSNCGLIQVYPQKPQKMTLKRYSEFTDPLYEKERETRSRNYQRIITSLNTFQPQKGHLLDVGCATGVLLEIAQKNGWQATGLEPSRWAVNLGKNKYKLVIRQGSLDTIKFKKNSFDAVSCIDVIEHVTSPSKLFKKIHQFLKPGGLLCIVTPDIGSLAAKFLGEKWWHIRPDHIYYFTQNSLSQLLASRGFKIDKTSTYSWSFSLNYWMSRIGIKTPFYNLNNTVLTLDFHDSLEVYARKT